MRRAIKTQKGESMIQKYPRHLVMLFTAMALAVALPTDLV